MKICFTLNLIVFLLCLSSVLSAQDLGSIGKAKPVSFHGGLNLSSTVYAAKNTEGRQPPFSWVLSGNATVDVYGVQFPLSVIYAKNSEQYSLPFQRFGLSPYYKWVKLHLGHRNYYFNQFVTAGQPIFGAGIELNPKKLRFAAVYGRIAKAEFIDSTRANFAGQPSVFERKGVSVKLGLGSERNHVDVNVLKAHDDLTSLPPSVLANKNTKAAENVAIGVSTRFGIGKYLVWSLEAAGSAYTRDLTAQTVALPDSFKIVKTATSVFQPYFSSQLLTAGETSLRVLLGKSSVQVAYRRVSPDYKSMGVFFFQNDVEQYTFSPNLVLFQNKVLLTGSVGIQQDNLLRQKLFTSKRFIGNANLSWRPNNVFSANAQYSNFGLTQTRFTDFVQDSLQLRLVNQTIGANLQWSLMKDEGKMQIISLSTNYQGTEDASPTTGGIGNLKGIFASLMYSYVLPQKQLNLFGGLNLTNNTFANGKTSFYGLTLGADKGFLQNKLSLRSSASYFLQNTTSTAGGSTLNARLGLVWQVLKGQSLVVNANFVSLSSGRQEWFGTVSYGLSF
jgi:hypothetical protein